VNEVVKLERNDAIAIVTVNSPPVNALSAAVRGGIFECMKSAIADPEVKAIVLTCGGRTFIAGADITEFGKPPKPPGLAEVLELMENSPKPIVAAIHGTALGGGLEVALACHYRVATKEARLGLPEVKLGLLPGAGGTQRLPRAVGKAKAMDLILTARMMDAEEAERAGLVSRIVPDGQLLEEALAIAAKIAAFSTPAVMMAKESVNRAYETTLAEGVRFERRMFHASFALADQKEGMAAFVEKRKPAFKNR